MIVCSQSQSLNTCKMVGVSGHIPKLLGTWGLSTINLGKCPSQASRPKESKFVWVGTIVFGKSMFLHGDKVEQKYESLEPVQPWRVNSRASWSIL
jgi:hypothetical protein